MAGGKFKYVSLTDIYVQTFKCKFYGAHYALYDAIAVGDIYRSLLATELMWQKKININLYVYFFTHNSQQ